MLHASLRIGKSLIHDKGIFATQDIKAKEVIHKMQKNEFPKVRISELKKWPEKKINDFVHYAFQGGKTFYYGMNHDNSFFMNHSCNPNCWYDGGDKIVARFDISKGEELTIDYAMLMSPSGLEKPFKCLCGQNDCRGEISKFDCLSKILRKKYKGHFLPFIELNFNEGPRLN